MLEIGNVKLSGKMALAPMAGASDLAFRHICFEAGAALACTEMVSAKALVYQDAKTRLLLRSVPGAGALAAQIFGSEPGVMAEAALKALDISGADIIDINMGCPVRKIVSNGEGCALMREPGRAAAIISAVVSAVKAPVTVKFRKGWDNGSVNAVEFARMCEDSGASAVTVHGRTAAQMYEGKADWDIIGEVKRAVKIPVFANGDVFTAQDAVSALRRSGADGVAVGRGALGNPWIFTRGQAAITGDEIPPPPSLSERVDTAMRQFTLSAGHKGEKIACLEARRHFAWYLKGVPHSGRFKRRIVQIESLGDAMRIADEIKSELR